MHIVQLEGERLDLTTTIEEASAVAADAAQMLHATSEDLSGVRGTQLLVQLVTEVRVHSIGPH
jgi:hypothetical protein